MNEERRYALKTSGHGSGYRFDSGCQDEPKDSDLRTFEEVVREAIKWEGEACTIGGRSLIYDAVERRVLNRNEWDNRPGMILVSEIVESNGKTVRENNLLKQHKYPIGTLVEVKTDAWHGDGACSLIHARLWVVSHDRDCDGTPLYSLSSTPRHKWNFVSTIIKFSDEDGMAWQLKDDISQNVFYKVMSGFDEDSLTPIELTENIKKGEGALEWDNGQV